LLGRGRKGITNPENNIEAIREPNREWMLRCKSILDIQDENRNLRGHGPTRLVIGLQAAGDEPAAVEIDEEWQSSLARGG
jgi:hypothetical protein